MKKIISILLTVVTLMSVFSMAFSVSAEGEGDTWYTYDGDWYCHDENGNDYMDGIYYVQIDGTEYEYTYFCFDEEGRLDKSLNGWLNYEYSPNCYEWVYFVNGQAVKGWKKIDGYWYYFTPSMVSDCVYSIRESGTVYYFTKSGKWNTSKNGWVKQNYGGQTYWFYMKNGRGILGWKKIDGYWYFFNPSMATGVAYVYESGKYYAFTNSGKWLSNKSGWYRSGGYWYYLKKGVVVEGWKKIDGKWYYLDPWMYENGPYSIDGQSYYFNKDGSWMEKGGKWYLDSRGYWFYYKNGKLATGWQKINNKWYYFDESMVHGGWYWIDGKYYYFNNDGTYNKSVTDKGR